MEEEKEEEPEDLIVGPEGPAVPIPTLPPVPTPKPTPEPPPESVPEGG